MRGSLHCGGFAAFGRDDGIFVVLGYGESKSKSNGKCGGLSTAAALPPSVEMTPLEVGLVVEMTRLEMALAVEMTPLEVGLVVEMRILRWDWWSR
jgi:hypothetical protein